jgi:hypothetical protein
MDYPDADSPSGKTEVSAEPTTEGRPLTPVGVVASLRGGYDLVTARQVEQQLEQSLRGALPMLNGVETLEQGLADGDANSVGRAV